MDADALILNRERRIETLINQLSSHHCAAFATDDNGLCAGIFLLRTSNWSSMFMDTVYFLGDINFEDQYGDGVGGGVKMGEKRRFEIPFGIDLHYDGTDGGICRFVLLRAL